MRILVIAEVEVEVNDPDPKRATMRAENYVSDCLNENLKEYASGDVEINEVKAAEA